MLNNVSPISFNGLVPLKKYKGPLLKLTKAEETKIAALQANINELEIELYNIDKFCSTRHLTYGQENYYFNKIDIINTHIRELKEEIRKIKINSLKNTKN